MSTAVTPQPADTPMISPDFASTKLVPAEQVASAQAAGWDTAVRMTGPQGELKWVPSKQTDQARQANFAVHPDNPGAVKMVTPQGEINYALPGEVDTFKKAGHTLINPD